MAELRHIFLYLCGRPNTWSLGGELLPFCQRCTGFYVGGALAAVLYALFHPRPTRCLLAFHGILLLQMAPFGYHWVAQNGTLRTLAGQLFAFGLIYFLALNPAAQFGLWKNSDREHLAHYALGGLLGIAALQLAVHRGGTATGVVLAWLGFAGLLVYAALVLVNFVVLPWAIWGFFRRPQGA